MKGAVQPLMTTQPGNNDGGVGYGGGGGPRRAGHAYHGGCGAYVSTSDVPQARKTEMFR